MLKSTKQSTHFWGINQFLRFPTGRVIIVLNVKRKKRKSWSCHGSLQIQSVRLMSSRKILTTIKPINYYWANSNKIWTINIRWLSFLCTCLMKGSTGSRESTLILRLFSILLKALILRLSTSGVILLLVNFSLVETGMFKSILMLILLAKWWFSLRKN